MANSEYTRNLAVNVAGKFDRGCKKTELVSSVPRIHVEEFRFGPMYAACCQVLIDSKVFVKYCTGWRWDPTERPTFKEIHEALETMFQNSSISEGTPCCAEPKTLEVLQHTKLCKAIATNDVRFTLLQR